MKLRPLPGTNSIPTSTAVRVLEPSRDLEPGSGIKRITESTEKLTAEDNLLGFGLGPA